MPSTRELNGVLNRIGNFDPSQFKDDFDSRLVLQKTIYLLQAFDLNLGYQFNWYLRGPYSPDLAHATYSLADCYDKEVVIEFSNTRAEERFGEFLRFLGKRKNEPGPPLRQETAPGFS